MWLTLLRTERRFSLINKKAGASFVVHMKSVAGLSLIKKKYCNSDDCGGL